MQRATKFRRRLIKVGIAVLVALFCGFGAGIRAARETSSMNQWAVHAQEVLSVSNTARLNRPRMQNSLWLYRATRNEQYLEFFRTSRIEFRENIAKLSALTSDNPRQTALLNQIELVGGKQVAQLQEAMNRTVTAMRTGTPIDFGPPSQSSDELTGLLNVFEANEKKLFAERSTNVQKGTQTTLILLLVTGVVSCTALLFAGRQIQKEIQHRAQVADGLLHAQELMGMRLSEQRSELGHTLEDLHKQIAARNNAEAEMRGLNCELEDRVRRRTRQLEEMNQELESFSYSVSHDLRAPLRHLDGFSRILEQQFTPQLSEEGRHYLLRIRSAAAQMSALVEDLLQLSHLGRQPTKCQPIELGILVEDARKEVLAEAEGRQILWEIEKLPEVEADPVLFRQVFTNLLSNAVKFTRKRDRALIEIGSRKEGSQTIVFVRDNGDGFDPRCADKLFGVFQRLHRQDEFEGTGIGLATVQRIIQKHGGKVWAESQPGRGATFFFTVNTIGTKDPPHMEMTGARA